jgi:hypothetical protein
MAKRSTRPRATGSASYGKRKRSWRTMLTRGSLRLPCATTLTQPMQIVYPPDRRASPGTLIEFVLRHLGKR